MEVTVAYQPSTELVVSIISSVLAIAALGVLFWGRDIKSSSSSVTANGGVLRAALSSRPRTYLPFVKELAKGVMGLRPLQEDTGGRLLDIDCHYLTQMELKRTLLRHARADVFGVAHGLESAAAEAAKEALRFLVDRLSVEYPGLVHLDPASGILANSATGQIWRVENEENHPLIQACLLVQEDLAIMLPQGDNYVLGAAAVCFADQWRLPEKLGLPLRGIHGPVKHYPRIAPAVDKFFAGLRPGGERVRYNMTFCERPTLHLPERPSAEDCPMPDNGLPHEIYMRVERQALVRLPASGAVLFTIRTYRQNVLDIPKEHHAALLRSLEADDKTTPLAVSKKDTFRERIRERLCTR